jgi:RNA polymerase sigma-B factor
VSQSQTNAPISLHPRPSHPTQLTPDELTALFTRWQHDRDQDARAVLIERFMPLARSLARRYQGANEPIDDLVQVASLALLLAIDRFDTGRELSFATFAVPTILGELRRYFRDSGWSVRVPRAAKERALKVERAVKTIAARDGREPTIPMLAQYLEWPQQDVLVALEAGAAHHSASLNAPAHDDTESPSELIDTVGSDEDGYDRVEAELSLAAACRRLPWQARRAIALRFNEDLTQAEIGERLGTSQMQVSRVLRSALAEIRASIAQPV